MLVWLSETGKIWGFQAFWSCSVDFSSLWWPFGWNWSYLGFLGIIWRTCGSKCRGEGGGIFPTLCVECCLVSLCCQSTSIHLCTQVCVFNILCVLVLGEYSIIEDISGIGMCKIIIRMRWEEKRWHGKMRWDDEKRWNEMRWNDEMRWCNEMKWWDKMMGWYVYCYTFTIKTPGNSEQLSDLFDDYASDYFEITQLGPCVSGMKIMPFRYFGN